MKGKNTYYIELVWNREFHFVPYGEPHTNLTTAIKTAQGYEAMGDGEVVKKTRILDQDGDVVWQYGKRCKKTCTRSKERSC